MAPQALTAVLDRLRARLLRPGESGEELACGHLESAGYVILARNYRCQSGEVDVVARDGTTTVFVEVKERRGASHGEGHEAVTFGKRRRIVRAARLYAAIQGLSDGPVRFDVVSVDWGLDGALRLRHDRGAFDADGR
ncbi:MAG: YraN family protein [Acidobacteria bacterium]|nr:YraN family protein [Acidobacteriota bacterium]